MSESMMRESDGRSDLPLDRRQFGVMTVAGLLSGCCSTTTEAPTGDLASYPALARKYPRLCGTAQGWYEGRAEDGNTYRLPRRVDPAVHGTSLVSRSRAVYEVRQLRHDSLSFEQMLQLIESTVPQRIHERVRRTIEAAGQFASGDAPTGAPLPPPSELERLRQTLLLTWVHSRDVSTLTSALGYPSPATGRHDVDEPVLAQHVKAASRDLRERQSDWYLRYIDSFDDAEFVNVGFFNPHLAVDAFQWRPGAELENSIVAHRLSSHHRGNPELSLDPIEGAVNRMHHSREDRLGVRKSPCATIAALGSALDRPTDALRLMGSSFGIAVARDALELMARLEHEGRMTPWFACEGC